LDVEENFDTENLKNLNFIKNMLQEYLAQNFIPMKVGELLMKNIGRDLMKSMTDSVLE
jgi:hypothetical protein